MICEVCGFPKNDAKHEKYHHHFFLMESKCGYMYTYEQRETIKRQNFDIIGDDMKPLENKVTAAIRIFRTYYCRSLEACTNIDKHVMDYDFFAMLLNGEHFKNRFGTEVYNELVKRYGRKPGIANGKTSYHA